MIDPRNPRLERSPLHLLHRASQRCSDLFAREMAKGGLTMRQFAVLVTVSQEEGLRQTDLVDLTGIDRSTLADIVQRLVDRGLLERSRMKQDGRAYAVRLTEAGKAALVAAEPAISRAEAKLLGTLAEGSRRDFLESLLRIVASDEAAQSLPSCADAAVVTPGATDEAVGF